MYIILSKKGGLLQQVEEIERERESKQRQYQKDYERWCYYFSINSTKKADKVPTITWKDSDGNAITNVKGRYSVESYGRVLKIENLVETDEKSYTCTGVNKLGRAEGTIHINITCSLDFLSSFVWFWFWQPHQSGVLFGATRFLPFTHTVLLCLIKLHMVVS